MRFIPTRSFEVGRPNPSHSRAHFRCPIVAVCSSERTDSLSEADQHFGTAEIGTFLPFTYDLSSG